MYQISPAGLFILLQNVNYIFDQLKSAKCDYRAFKDIMKF